MTVAIEIQNLSKKYQLGSLDGISLNKTLVETFTRKAHLVVEKLCFPFLRGKKEKTLVNEEFWALQGVSFDIHEGDRVGIIGRNGAGKSTLLKILSQITAPTSGRVKIKGRLSSLLEVGTGFHLELTGRENIFLNGAILGMKRKEIQSKFDEIVDFAEMEKFLDTPVKRFSSGMCTRLGFAIAAHLDSDILILDEVLAVGDTQFQAKCFKKIDHLGASGRTVLFVSHDVNSVLSLCNKGIYLENGIVKESGAIEPCVSAYVKHLKAQSFSWEGVLGDEHIRIYSAVISGAASQFFYQNEVLSLSIDYEILKPHSDLFLSVGIWNMRNQLIARSHTFEDPKHHEEFLQVGKRRLSFKFNTSLFNAGEYLIKLQLAIHNGKKISDEAISLRFPVYSQIENTRFAHAIKTDGINLGSNWSWVNE